MENYMLNPYTGRQILIGGRTHIRLVDHGLLNTDMQGGGILDTVKTKAKRAGAYVVDKAVDLAHATGDLIDSNPNFTQQLLTPLFGGHKSRRRR